MTATSTTEGTGIRMPTTTSPAGTIQRAPQWAQAIKTEAIDSIFCSLSLRAPTQVLETTSMHVMMMQMN